MEASSPISFCNFVFAATRSWPSTGIWDFTTRQRKSSRRAAWKKLAAVPLNAQRSLEVRLSFAEGEVHHATIEFVIRLTIDAMIHVFHRLYGIPRQSERLALSR
jgi:hypothetical protein